MSKEYEIIHEGPCSLGEGVMWDHRLGWLFWIDIEGKALHLHDAAGHRAFALSGMPGTVVLTQDPRKLLLALETGLTVFDLEAGLEEQYREFPEGPESRFNDGKCDAAGRLWVGTMRRDAQPGSGNLYRVGSDVVLEKRLEGATVSNGICWSSDDRTMYYIDSATREVHAFDYDKGRGEISRRRTVVRVPVNWGYPDGMTIDLEGKLWVAHWDGGCVARYDPENGEVLTRIDLPAPKVTSCCFGGDDMESLFVTTALGSEDGGWADREEYPDSGAVFKLRPGVKGSEANIFGVP